MVLVVRVLKVLEVMVVVLEEEEVVVEWSGEGWVLSLS